jgi:hypothetical protein
LAEIPLSTAAIHVSMKMLLFYRCSDTTSRNER